MKILGIETSCDETAAAVVENGTKILSNIVASSQDLHAKTGGIIPEDAARAQLQSITPIVIGAIAEAAEISNFKFPISKSVKTKLEKYINKEIDAIAVTAGGPGLIGSMLVGVETAKTLSYVWQKPLVPVVHLLAHVYANWLTEKPKPTFPSVVLTISGGHSDILLMKAHGKYKWLGGTRDDAAGEAFDKTARLLGLSYPGGPAISKEALKFQKSISEHKLKMFPRPMIDKNILDFSFSGLKTSVFNKISNSNNSINVSQYSAEIQEAIVDVLVDKALKTVKIHKPKSLLLAGGVAANKRLKEKFNKRIKAEYTALSFHVPDPSLCVDNATFVSSYAFFNYKPVTWNKVIAISNPSDASKLYGNYKDR